MFPTMTSPEIQPYRFETESDPEFWKLLTRGTSTTKILWKLCLGQQMLHFLPDDIYLFTFI